ncbi:hypothetical protein [Microbispora hainanensis]|uniref:hypothetical protein n=1 Tax=Microbispora hainanensis TaxID=568844 RepID=UPI001ABFFD0B|nr:hypothetical protein [Microbispora hainanensis]
MLELARERSVGALTYHVTVAHTARAREILGPDAFLGVEHAVLFESDPARARAAAREHLRPYLNTPYNIAKFRRLGYPDEEITGGGSDRLVDDLVFWGDLDTIVAKLGAHRDAGADHVAIQVIGVEPGKSPMPHWRLLGDCSATRCCPSRPASGSRPEGRPGVLLHAPLHESEGTHDLQRHERDDHTEHDQRGAVLEVLALLQRRPLRHALGDALFDGFAVEHDRRLLPVPPGPDADHQERRAAMAGSWSQGRGKGLDEIMIGLVACGRP